MDSHLTKVLAAFTLVSPLCLGVRYEQLTRCVEASVNGARALRKFGIQAKAIPCSLTALNEEAAAFCVSGLTKKELYDRLCTLGFESKDYETWLAEDGAAVEDVGELTSHFVIEARFQGERALIDPTFGQIKESADRLGVADGVKIPLHTILYLKKGWPSFQLGPWHVEYASSLREEFLLSRTEGYRNQAYFEDIKEMMTLALACDCRPEVFFPLVRQGQPEAYRTAMNRLSYFLSDPK